ncbi:Ctr copper transporter [Cubamyces lactineus]|nr:Ctr copper transporter [Cubamyces lactineus]
MDMSSSSNSSSMIMAMMIPWLHFTSGDNLLFQTWHPSSHGAIAGACLGLVVLAVFERWVDAMRGVAEDHWRCSARASMMHDKPNETCHSQDLPVIQDKTVSVEEMNVRAPVADKPRQARGPRTIPPFIASHDIPRGALYAFQALLMYALMLAVMTFQAAYIISIVVGLGIGEVLFGRVGGAKNHMLH